jgi:hypothetical protein
MTGPHRTLAVPYNAAVQLSHCGHSCMAQHFCRLKRRCADLQAIHLGIFDSCFGKRLPKLVIANKGLFSWPIDRRWAFRR